MANVPTTPSRVIGTAEPLKRRHPTFIPPSKRITISATTPIRSTLRIEIAVPSDGKTSDAIAAANRNSAGAGIGNQSAKRLATSASENPAEQTRMITPKSCTSLIAAEPTRALFSR